MSVRTYEEYISGLIELVRARELPGVCLFADVLCEAVTWCA